MAPLMRVCIITDNVFLYEGFRNIIAEKKYNDVAFDFYCTEAGGNKPFIQGGKVQQLSLKNTGSSFFEKYELFFSAHCKQIFPDELIRKKRCINIHPGLNPYNRGWFPQVFSIINKLPAGVTIHEMDSELDHGPIIFQQEVAICEEDTSYDVYQKIQETEMQLLRKHFDELVYGRYTKLEMKEDGNINYKKDFEDLCRIDLDKRGSYREFIDELRALTFAGCDNAYFYNQENEKVYVSICLKRE